MAYCIPMKLPGGGTALVRMSGRRPDPCQFCQKRLHTRLCDKIVGRRTCDAKMCDECRTVVDSKTDFCPIHARELQ